MPRRQRIACGAFLLLLVARPPLRRYDNCSAKSYGLTNGCSGFADLQRRCFPNAPRFTMVGLGAVFLWTRCGTRARLAPRCRHRPASAAVAVRVADTSGPDAKRARFACHATQDVSQPKPTISRPSTKADSTALIGVPPCRADRSGLVESSLSGKAGFPERRERIRLDCGVPA
jgi:hypothetical protein